MPRERSKLNVKSKVWIEDVNGKVVFGSGRAEILNAINEHGSIVAASKVLRMSYRAVWGKIRASENRLGRSLVEKRVDSHGGGSDLTPFAKALLEHFTHMDDLIRTTSDRLFQDDFIVSMAGGNTRPDGETEGLSVNRHFRDRAGF